MTPQDPRHGTTRGYAAGCRDLCCRRAQNADEARRRKYRQALGITRSVPATGTVRRIQALWALGWTSRHIADWCGWTTPQAVTEVSGRKIVYTGTAETIRRVYEQHSMQPGPSAKNRREAARKGWFPPLSWDDIDTDCGPISPQDSVTYDEAVVLRILAGERLPATQEERREVVARWHDAGRSLGELERITGWRTDRYREGAA